MMMDENSLGRQSSPFNTYTSPLHTLLLSCPGAARLASTAIKCSTSQKLRTTAWRDGNTAGGLVQVSGFRQDACCDQRSHVVGPKKMSGIDDSSSDVQSCRHRFDEGGSGVFLSSSLFHPVSLTSAAGGEPRQLLGGLSRRAREHDYVADILKPADKLHEPVESNAKACMRNAPEPPQIQVPLERRRRHV